MFAFSTVVYRSLRAVFQMSHIPFPPFVTVAFVALITIVSIICQLCVLAHAFTDRQVWTLAPMLISASALLLVMLLIIDVAGYQLHKAANSINYELTTLERGLSLDHQATLGLDSSANLFKMFKSAFRKLFVFLVISHIVAIIFASIVTVSAYIIISQNILNYPSNYNFIYDVATFVFMSLQLTCVATGTWYSWLPLGYWWRNADSSTAGNLSTSIVRTPVKS